MRIPLIVVVIFLSSAFEVAGQVSSLEWIQEVRSLTGHVNYSGGGITGDLAISSDGSEVIVIGNNSFTGSSVYLSTNDSIESGLFIASYNTTTGDLLWVKNFGKNGWIRPQSLKLDSEGNIFILGDFGYMKYGLDSLVSNYWTDMFLAKHDPEGNLIWIKQMGSSTVNNVGYDDTSVDLLVTDYEVYVNVETHGNFMYADSVIVDVQSPANVLLRVDKPSGSLINYATVHYLGWANMDIGTNGKVFCYSNVGQVSSINGVAQNHNGVILSHLIIFSSDLELERIVDLNLDTDFTNLLVAQSGQIILGGVLPGALDSVEVDGVSVHGFNNPGNRWLMLMFDEEGEFLRVSDTNPILPYVSVPMVISSGEEILILDSQGEVAFYDLAGNHMLTQTLTTGNMSYRNAVFDTIGSSMFLYSNYTGGATILNESLASMGGTTDALLGKLTYKSPSSSSFMPSAYSINVFPNPTSGQISIETQEERIRTINLTNLLGKQLLNYSANGIQQIELDLNGYQNGVYLVELELEDGGKEVRRLVIQR